MRNAALPLESQLAEWAAARCPSGSRPANGTMHLSGGLENLFE